jgi:tetratricopeptide (TPR) repeat protein
LVNCPPWSYDLIVVGAVLALLPTLAILIGAAAATVHFIRQPAPAWVFLLGLAFTALLAIIYMTLTVPSYAQAKAFYGLVALVPICALAGLGLDWLGGRWLLLRGLLLAALLTWALTALAAYWVCPSDPLPLIFRAFQLDRTGHRDAAIAQAQAALALDPNVLASRVVLIRLLHSRDPNDPEIDRLLAAGEAGRPAFDTSLRNAEDAARHVQQWHRFLRIGDAAHAIAEGELAAQLDPDSLDKFDIYYTAAALNRRAGRLDRAIDSLRQAIRLDPYLSQFHAELADLYVQTQQFDLANQQRIYARRAADARRDFLQRIDAK